MSIVEAKKLIDQSNSIVVLTGAGISTDSGIPDFRGKDGIWTKNPELEKLTNINNYYNSPELRQSTWDAYLSSAWDEALPNDGHLAITKLHELGKLRNCITQNVDGLHIKAGIPSGKVIELHGNLREVKCIDCELITPKAAATIVCSRCGGVNKPNMIFFGELLYPLTWWNAERSMDECDLLLIVGTSLMVSPATDIPIMAKHDGTKIIYVNGDPSPKFIHTDIELIGSISEILPEIINEN